MQIAIAFLAGGLVLACVASLAMIYRHQKLSQATVKSDVPQASRP